VAVVFVQYLSAAPLEPSEEHANLGLPALKESEFERGIFSASEQQTLIR